MWLFPFEINMQRFNRFVVHVKHIPSYCWGLNCVPSFR